MSKVISREYLKSLGLRALASFLILWTPFFAFSAYRDHPIPPLSLLYFAVLCVLLALILSALCGRAGYIRQAILFTGLIALFLDVQVAWFTKAPAYIACVLILGLCWLLRRHLSAILSSVFAALLVSTAVVGSLEPYVEVRVNESASEGSSGEEKSHRVVHLLLDEHAGIQGIPEDLPGGKALRQRLIDFFVSNGFRIFGNAISEYQASRNSIAGILNFTAGPEPYELYYGKKPYVLTKNTYFETLSEAGYGIDVIQTTYMDYCREHQSLVVRCHTYRYDSSNWLKTAALSDFDKLQVFFGLYLQLSNIAEKVLKAYAKLERSMKEQGISLPAILDWPSPIAMVAFDQVIDDATSGPGGRLYFAHLLMPHGSYAFDAECRLRSDISSWVSNRPPYRKENSESERALSYHFYFEQLRCTQRRLQSLFDRLRSAGLFADTTIILHGDHGSRIHRLRARAKNRDKFTRQDFLDGFSTLFAIKSPAFEAGYDNEVAPVSHLLARAIGRPDLIEAAKQELFIYLEGSDDYDPWTPVPFPMSN